MNNNLREAVICVGMFALVGFLCWNFESLAPSILLLLLIFL